MNNYSNISPIVEIDIKDIIWKLLMQWKAILIICLFSAILFSSAKYSIDKRAYDAAIAELDSKQNVELQSVDDQIAKVLGELSSTDRDAVSYAIKQQEMIALQQDYLNNSYLINVDPTSQRTIIITYLITRNSDCDLQPLLDAYNDHFHSTKCLSSFREVINPDIKLEYISEIVITNNNLVLPDSSSNEFLYQIMVVAPENISADSIVAVVNSEISIAEKQLDTLIGNHSIKFSSTDDRHQYNQTAVDRRNNVVYNINNLKNSITNTKNSLSTEQNVALETIEAIKKSAETNNSEKTESISAPSFSKKIAVLGFAFGAFIYFIIYICYIIVSKKVSSANTLQNSTGKRLLGEVYSTIPCSLLRKLFTSQIIAKIRYGSKLDQEKQTDSIVATIDALCEHLQSDTITLFLSGIDKEFDSILNAILNKCKVLGKSNINILTTEEMPEKALTKISDAIFVISSDSKLNNIWKLSALCDDYDITNLGYIYLEGI